MGKPYYIKIRVIYCTKLFDEILGVTSDGKYVAAFIFANKTYTPNKTPYNIVYVENDCVFPIDKLDPNILPYMKYGAIALFALKMFHTHDIDLVCEIKAIQMIFRNIILYHKKKDSITKEKIHIHVINENCIEMNNIQYDIHDYTFLIKYISANIIQEAINNTVQQTNIVILEMRNIHDICNITTLGHVTTFFEVLKICF